ncbi:MAG: hypothetical protein K0S82_20 [Gaiellaceae bacterium]|jgi:hypothetical protein|nr:hypothetical protein [Gaiellaceae bacterium]
MSTYRKKPVKVEAVQLRGGYTQEIKDFMGEHPHEWDGAVGLKIPTLEGVMVASQYDWIIRGVEGELYPCKPGIFGATYEEVLEFDAEEQTAECEPHLGCATTAQMLHELTVRAEIGGYANYRTVDGHDALEKPVDLQP